MDIKVWLIGKTQPTSQLQDYLAYHNTTQTIDGCDSIVGYSGKRCYLAFEPGANLNVTKVRRDWHDYFENILSSGHGSVLESVTFNFAIEGLSRVATAELNRHRAGVAISEGSMRYIRTDKLSWWMPDSLKVKPEDPPGLKVKKQLTLQVFNEVFADTEHQLRRLNELWEIDTLPFGEKKKLTSLFRRIIPLGVSTGGIWSFNLRALRHIIALRSTEHAEEEIVHLMNKIIELAARETELLDDFSLVDGFWVPKYKKV